MRLAKILIFGVLLLNLLACSKDEASERLPNIIFIMADDMGQGDLGCYNPESKILTAEMDALATNGMRFTNVHAPSSVCSPTRYGVLTGRYAWRTWLKKGTLGPFDKLMVDTTRTTVADLLKSAGYATAAIGKWHLGLGYADSIDYYQASLKPGPLELGFDVFFGMNASLNMSPHCFIDGHTTVGTPNIPVPEHVFSNHGNKLMVLGWKHEDVGPTFTRKAVTFIENHLAKNPQQPFYLHLTPSAPHRPLYPPDFIMGRSQAGKRGDMVAEVDWTVGQVMQTLNKLGIMENTLVVLTSDNGAIDGNHSKSEDSLSVKLTYGHLSNAHWRGSKTTIWEGGTRVPFLVHWPSKVPTGQSSDKLGCLTDWMATVAAITGQQIQKNMAEDSYNLLPLILGKANSQSPREALVTHSMQGKFAIRKGSWKLALTQSSGGWGSPLSDDYPPGQLYNLANDSLETENLYSEYPSVVNELEALLTQYQQTGRSRP